MARDPLKSLEAPKAEVVGPQSDREVAAIAASDSMRTIWNLIQADISERGKLDDFRNPVKSLMAPFDAEKLHPMMRHKAAAKLIELLPKPVDEAPQQVVSVLQLMAETPGAVTDSE